MTASTIVALSSGALPSGIAVLRLSGPAAIGAGSAFCKLPATGVAALRSLRDPDGSLIDSALVLRFDAPRSATGENLVEFHLHGSPAIVDRMIALLTVHEGVRMALPGEFTRRALLNGKMDLIEAEALSDLLAAETEEQRRQAMAQVHGSLSGEIHALLDRVIDLSAEAEATIDYVGDEEELARAAVLEEGVDRLSRDLRMLLATPSRRPLHDGIRVVLAGPANSGKSSVLNALAGYERAIVDDVAGTTRDTIEVPIRLAERAYVVVDTAGLREGKVGRIERQGIDRSRSAMQMADILCWFGRPDDAPDHPNLLQFAPKSDEGMSWQGIPVSTRTENGTDALVAAIREVADGLLPAPGEPVLNRRHRDLLVEAEKVLGTSSSDPVIAADSLARCRNLFERLIGFGTMDQTLDRIFAKFCLGK